MTRAQPSRQWLFAAPWLALSLGGLLQLYFNHRPSVTSGLWSDVLGVILFAAIFGGLFVGPLTVNPAFGHSYRAKPAPLVGLGVLVLVSVLSASSTTAGGGVWFALGVAFLLLACWITIHRSWVPAAAAVMVGLGGFLGRTGADLLALGLAVGGAGIAIDMLRRPKGRSLT